MTRRNTQSQLETLVGYLNKELPNMDFSLCRQNYGWSLRHDGGGSDTFGIGSVSKTQLFNHIHTYLRGIRDTKKFLENQNAL